MFVHFTKPPRLFSVALASRRRPRPCQSGHPPGMEGEGGEETKQSWLWRFKPCSSGVHHPSSHSVKELAFSAASSASDFKAVQCFNKRKKCHYLFAVCTVVLFFLFFLLPVLPELALCSRAAPFKVDASPDKDNSFTPIFITKHKFYTASLSKGSLTHFPVPCSIRVGFFSSHYLFTVCLKAMSTGKCNKMYSGGVD